LDGWPIFPKLGRSDKANTPVGACGSDRNDGLQLSYNMLHKPGLLGVLGAIVGLEGYKQKGELPMYYQQLKHLLVSIEHWGMKKEIFRKHR